MARPGTRSSVPLIDPSEPAESGCCDNINGDLIVFEHSEIRSPDGQLYIIERPLGSGQYGKVYAVTRISSSGAPPQPLAMKISRSTTDSHAQFKYEIQVLEYVCVYFHPLLNI
jgi:serine/threonine protein kinase